MQRGELVSIPWSSVLAPLSLSRCCALTLGLRRMSPRAIRSLLCFYTLGYRLKVAV